jgi:TetR/AcrR family transcriptional regulator, cholesterol catabolism regulator
VAEKGTTTRTRGPRRGVNGVAARRRDQEVLDAAAKVFHERGYADASVQHIADELGILKGSLYHYIDSKEDLLFRILEEAHHEVEAILADVEGMDAPPLAKLHEYTRRQVEYTSRNLAKMAIYYHDVDQLSETRRKALYKRRRVHEQFVVDCIAQAQERGETRPGIDPRLSTNYLFGSMIWVYRWYRPSGKVKPAQVAADCADFVVSGITGTRA